MLEVKIDMVPFGYESHRRTIHSIKIINDGKHPKRPFRGSCVVIMDTEDQFEIPDHDRNLGVLDLVRKAIGVFLREAR